MKNKLLSIALIIALILPVLSANAVAISSPAVIAGLEEYLITSYARKMTAYRYSCTYQHLR